MKSFFDDFLRQGYTIQKVENLDFLNKLKLKIKEELVRDELDLIHKNCSPSEINSLRISLFRKINNIKNWENQYFSLAASKLTDLLGPDLSIQSKLISYKYHNDNIKTFS